MKTGLLWNTFRRDFEWFRYSAASFLKFARGWDYATCVVPAQDRELFEPVCKKADIHLLSGEEWPDAGFNWHQMIQCKADHMMPYSDAIWHFDGDCAFIAPCEPRDFMSTSGKLIQNFFTFRERLAISEWGPGMWKSRVDAALGGDVELSVMTGHPHCHYREVYEATRNAVTRQHATGFDEYVRSCKNEFPQGFCEFETLGAIAQRVFHNDYHWNHLTSPNQRPNGHLVAEGWSHGGLDNAYDDRLDGKSTARQYFAALGIEPL